jgi:two-component system, OmpR family, sensor kinase
MRPSIRARLTLISGALMAAVLIGLGVFLYTRMQADLVAAVDAGLQSRASVLLNVVEAEGDLSDGRLDEGDESFAQLLATDGTVIAGSSSVSEPMLSTAQVLATEAVRFYDETVETVEEPVAARLLATPTANGDVLVVGASLEDQEDALARLLALLVVGIPAAVILASVVGWILAGLALRPVERLRREADAISASELDRRLAVPATGDELSRMAQSLNRMLDRLEAGVEHERRFLADASHELRTPLANLRAELDLALRQARTSDELVAALRSVREETDRLGRLAEDLLVLARADSGGLALRRQQISINELVEETVESFAGRAETLGIELGIGSDAAGTAFVDPVRMRQALGNLVDNALRHARTRVTLTLVRSGDTVELEVADDGPGFPAGFVESIGPSFARPDASRERRTGGTGLGLAIVRAIVDAHGGTVRFENDSAGGARATIELPVGD